MGHEAAGIVHEVGEGVTHLKPGHILSSFNLFLLVLFQIFF